MTSAKLVLFVIAVVVISAAIAIIVTRQVMKPKKVTYKVDQGCTTTQQCTTGQGNCTGQNTCTDALVCVEGSIAPMLGNPPGVNVCASQILV